jgi:leader peptidase (prepilin peptidase)/N-methyltransferase
MQVFIFLLGIILGSAANALIDRLPKNISWAKGRSVCDKCGHELNWYDLIPVISYLSLLRFNTPHLLPPKLGGREKGGIYARCRYCRSPIPLRNLIVELVMGIGFLVLTNLGNLSNLGYLRDAELLGIFWVTVIIAVMDWETMLVSEVLVVVWGVLTVLFSSSVQKPQYSEFD